MVNLKALPAVIAVFIFIACVLFGLVRLGVDFWEYYHPAVAGAPKVFHDHHGLGIVLVGLVLSAIFFLWFWFINKKAV
jgi:hypothetical protein